ncbi:MAG: FAD-dependent oxidoreductase, partial [Acidobacteriaceae bacterium]
FGAEVTILEMLPRMVPVEDEEISKELLRLFKKRGFDVNLGIKDTKIEKNKEGALVSWTDANGKAQTKHAEKVLVAVGRAPQTADIGLEKTKIAPERGFIMTNEWMETTEPGVYAMRRGLRASTRGRSTRRGFQDAPTVSRRSQAWG